MPADVLTYVGVGATNNLWRRRLAPEKKNKKMMIIKYSLSLYEKGHLNWIQFDQLIIFCNNLRRYVGLLYI